MEKTLIRKKWTYVKSLINKLMINISMLERCNKNWTGIMKDLKGKAKMKRNMQVLLKEPRGLSKLLLLEMRYVVARLKATITFISRKCNNDNLEVMC